MYKSLLFCAVIVLSGICLAQSESATLSGRVTDPGGSAVVEAQVVLTNVETNVESRTKTNNAGLYVFTGVHPGKYRVAAGATGFKVLIKDGLVLHVQDEIAENFALTLGTVSETVTVTADAAPLNTTDGSVSTVVDRKFVESLPLNGRSFNTLLQLTPGVVIAQQPSTTSAASPGQFSISGQRTDANNFSIDGVSANFGASGFNGGTGATQAFSAIGGTSSLISVDALQEFRIETSSYTPEFGRQSGGQVILTTRSGTNDFHGGVFDYFRNTAMDANDWFLSQAAKPRAAEHHNDFGGIFGGPLWKNKSFFFFSYEGARLDLPQGAVFNVPSAYARAQAAGTAIAPYLDAYPQPDNRTAVPGVYTAPLTAGYSNPGTLNAASLRIDHHFNDRFSIFGRYNYAPSSLVGVLSEPNNPFKSIVNTRTLTAGINMSLSSRLWNTIRANYSTQSTRNPFSVTSFAGAVPLDPALLLGSLPASNNNATFATFDTGLLAVGPGTRSHTTQLNFVDDLAVKVAAHQLKFGGDYRSIFYDNTPPKYVAFYSSPDVQTFVSTGTADLSTSIQLPAQLLAQSFSLYGQDTWNATSRLTLTYGLRWELAPAPSARGATTLASWKNTDNPSQIDLAPSGTPVWATTYGNLAPRVGAAYSLTPQGDFVFRAGWGLFYDLGTGQFASLTSNFPNSNFGFIPGLSLPVGDLTPFLPTIPPTFTQPPFPFVIGFASNLKLPRSQEWNVALEKSFGGKQVISATYVGHAGRRLLRVEGLNQPNTNFSSVIDLTRNTAQSSYDSLQLQYRRSLSAGLQMLLNYSWSHSIDDVSNDTVEVLPQNVAVISGGDYASSDFDVRHSVSAALSYEIPGPKSGLASLLAGHWSVESVVVARSGFPFNAVVFGVGPQGGAVFTRPDLTGQPAWIQDSTAGGGKSLNPNAFSVPTTPRQGTEGRNDVVGFGLTQVDLSLGRKFPITERLNLQFRADAFNVFNHPNFTNPLGYIQFAQFDPTFLKSKAMLNQGLGGLNPLFQEGGPRSLQLSLRLSF